MKTFSLSVDYEEFKPSTYKGVIIYDFTLPEGKQELIKVWTGNIKEDEKTALEELDKYVNESYEIWYLSKYDDYFMDLEYENNPEYRADVDRISLEWEDEFNRKE